MCSMEKSVLKNIPKSAGKQLCRSLFLIKLQGNFIKKEIPTQVLSFEFCKKFKSTFFTEYIRVTASDTQNGKIFLNVLKVFLKILNMFDHFSTLPIKILMIITLSVIRNLQVRINKTFCYNSFHTNICFLYANIFCFTQMHALLDENELN